MVDEANKYRAIIETSPSGILMMDNIGNIEYVSQRAEKILSISKENLIGNHINDFIHEESLGEFKLRTKKPT